MVVYIVWIKPFEETFMNNLEIFNEICILIVSLHLYLFTFFVPDPTIQYSVGWSIVIFTILNILVNMMVIIFMGAK